MPGRARPWWEEFHETGCIAHAVAPSRKGRPRRATLGPRRDRAARRPRLRRGVDRRTLHGGVGALPGSRPADRPGPATHPANPPGTARPPAALSPPGRAGAPGRLSRPPGRGALPTGRRGQRLAERPSALRSRRYGWREPPDDVRGIEDDDGALAGRGARRPRRVLVDGRATNEVR